jgi:hypothetical protein
VTVKSVLHVCVLDAFIMNGMSGVAQGCILGVNRGMDSTAVVQDTLAVTVSITDLSWCSQ